MALKVAIVGFADSRSRAPWDDPEWELWGLAWDQDWPRLDRTFEMHDPREFVCMPRGYEEALQHRNRLYMAGAFVPGCTTYPFDEVAKTTGAYWCSSLAYAMALAIHDGAQEIALWGVNMASDEEYGYQKPNMEYLIGLARGKGIAVHVPDSSPLLKFRGPAGCDYYGRYGRLK